MRASSIADPAATSRLVLRARRSAFISTYAAYRSLKTARTNLHSPGCSFTSSGPENGCRIQSRNLQLPFSIVRLRGKV